MEKFELNIKNIETWDNGHNKKEYYANCQCNGGWNGYESGHGNAFCKSNAYGQGFGGRFVDQDKINAPLFAGVL